MDTGNKNKTETGAGSASGELRERIETALWEFAHGKDYYNATLSVRREILDVAMTFVEVELSSLRSRLASEALIPNPLLGGDTMHYEVVESKQYRGHWHVEAIDSKGRVFVAIFSGPNARERAHEYAGWKNSVLAPAEKAQPAPPTEPK